MQSGHVLHASARQTTLHARSGPRGCPRLSTPCFATRPFAARDRHAPRTAVQPAAYQASNAGAATQAEHPEELPDMDRLGQAKGAAATREDRSHETDYVVIGSGIGGLCCAAMLAKYGYSVTVLESHYHAGGCAHGFEVQGYKFDAGPSFFLGLSSRPGTSSNPLKQVLDAVGESVECKQYDRWVVYNQWGTFPCVASRDAYLANIKQQGGQEALDQFLALEKLMEPLQRGAALFPAAAIRSDLGAALTAARFLSPLELARTGLVAGQLTGPFSAVVDKVVTNKWLRSFLDLECFVLSGMTARDTLTAEMAFMFLERNSGRSAIDYPMGGSASLVDALVRGIKKHGGRVILSSHVDQVVMEGGRAAGVKLRPRPGSRTAGAAGAAVGEEVVRARLGVVSNASVWDTQKLLPSGSAPEEWRKRSNETPQVDSFVHLHLGINAEGLPADLDCHHLIVNNWHDVTEPQSVNIVSIPTVFDPTLAPEGRHVVHAYYAASEPYEVWEGVQRGSQRYKEMKRERSETLWKALERVIPDVRQRAELQMVGTPLTHERFLRRHRGSYGPAISARDGAGWPGPKTPVPGLYVCGDSTMPGIGVPAAAASGLMCANSLAPVWSHLRMMDELLPASTAR